MLTSGGVWKASELSLSKILKDRVGLKELNLLGTAEYQQNDGMESGSQVREQKSKRPWSTGNFIPLIFV